MYPSWGHRILPLLPVFPSVQKIDLSFGIKPASCTHYPTYVREWKTAMKEAYELVAHRSRLSGMKGKRQYDRKDHRSVLQSTAARQSTSGKFTWKRWNLESYDLTYRVIKRKGEESPVYEVEPESGEGLCRVIHHNLLLPYNDFPFEENTDDLARPPK